MRESWQKKENVLPSANLSELADSSGKNHESSQLNHFHSSQKERREQKKIYLKEEASERKNADKILDDKLNRLNDIFGENVTSDVKDLNFDQHHSEEVHLGLEGRIKLLTRNLKQENTSIEKTLKALITHFENEEAIAVWVKNWKNFLRLHELAKTKPPEEQKVIADLIYKADFSSATSFGATLRSISASSALSASTKQEIAEEFPSFSFRSVKQVDKALKSKMKQRDEKKSVLKTLNREIKIANQEVKKLESKLGSLSKSSPEYQKTKNKLEKAKLKIDLQKSKANVLASEAEEEVAISLRENVKVILSKDGRRIITSEDEACSLQLPENQSLFSSRKNIRGLNCFFVYKAFANYGINQEIWKLPLKNGGVPDRYQRNLAYSVLEALNINADRIIKEEEIELLEKVVKKLLKAKSYLSPRENLKEFGLLKQLGFVKKEDIMDSLGKLINGSFKEHQTIS